MNEPSAQGGGAEKPRSRSVKTPLQKEVLEASYQLNPNPNEEHRRALGERIGLDEKQVQAWFINRRRKDKKAEENRKIEQAVQEKLAASGLLPTDAVVTEVRASAPVSVATAAASGSMGGAAPAVAVAVPVAPAVAVAAPGSHPHASAVLASSASRQSLAPVKMTDTDMQEYLQLLELAKQQIPGFREDGPALGAIFDDIPDSDTTGIKRKYAAMSETMEDDEDFEGDVMSHSLLRPNQRRMLDREERARLRIEEERMRELERAEQQRRKQAERMDKERLKEEARKLREQERQRLQQEKEAKKAEAAKEKERLAEEKKREREEKKREKELAKAQGRAAPSATKRAAHLPSGPPDDEDVELEVLQQAQRRAQGLPDDHPMEGMPEPARPEFPPPALNLCDAFDDALQENDLGPDLVMVSAFLHTFSDVLGLRPTPSLDQMAEGLLHGADSLVLSAVHQALMRLLQADLEEAHASGITATQAAGANIDRAMVSAAHQFEAAWAWGYDVDAWRAHLNVLTWPEILRELTVAVTLKPPKRMFVKKPKRPSKDQPRVGETGEDTWEDKGQLKLRLPARYQVGSVKAAAWQVLAEAGPEGLTIQEMTRRIQETGLRDLRNSKTPESTVAGALNRDVLFTRIATGTFALTSILQNAKRMGFTLPDKKDDNLFSVLKEETPNIKEETPSNTAPPTPGPEGNASTAPKTPSGAATSNADGNATTPGTTVKSEDGMKQEAHQHGEEDDGEGSDNEEYDEDGNLIDYSATLFCREPWANQLAARDYSELTPRQRLDALIWLMQSVLEGYSMRALMEARIEDAANIKKMLLEEAKEAKKRKQIEAQAKARIAAEEATRKLEELQAAGGSLPAPGSAAVTPGQGGVSDMAYAAQMAMEAAQVAAQRAAAASSEDADEEKVARQKRLELMRKADEEKAVRFEPLGLDRRHNRYWRVTYVVTSGGLSASPETTAEGQPADLAPNEDPSAGRVFVESADGSSWRLLSEGEQLDALIKLLEPKGAREGVLQPNLQLNCDLIKASMPSQIVTVAETEIPAPNMIPEKLEGPWTDLLGALRLQAAWLAAGHAPQLELNPDDHPRVQKIKYDMWCVCSALPPQATMQSFDRVSWVQAVQDAAMPSDLRRCLGQLEHSVLPAYLSVAYQRNPVVEKQAWSSPDREQVEAEAAAKEQEANAGAASALIEPLAWLPPTYAAIAFRLQALDASLYYSAARTCGRDRMLGYKYVIRPGPLARPCDGATPDMAALEPGAPHVSTEYGGITLNLLHSMTVTGKTRHVLLFPLLPGHVQAAPPQEFELDDIDWVREKVQEAEEQGVLYPPPKPPPTYGSYGNPINELSPDKQERVEAMRIASGIVRSAYARATQSRGGREKDKVSKAKAAKARKIKQGNAMHALERMEEEAPDYGAEYDDGYDEMTDMQYHQGGNVTANASEDPGDLFDPYGGAPMMVDPYMPSQDAMQE